MSDHTSIEWTDATWNPVTGCTKVSTGCDYCYAETFAERFRGTPGHYFENGFDVQLRENKLTEPLRWRKPRKVFVNSMSDLFHDAVPDRYIESVFSVMAEAKRHTFQVLTKRHARMRSLLSDWDFQENVKERYYDNATGNRDFQWPLPNVWLGVSTENQQWADIRIPALLDTPAAVRFISAEPLLGPIKLRREWGYGPGIDWLIVGGESGHGARPMHPDWARALRDHRDVVGAAFLFKQWGEWAPREPDDPTGERADVFLDRDGRGTYFANRYRADVQRLVRVGKKAAGREIDGRTWDEFPGGGR
ncbi:hypothetical protein SEA_CASHLINE_66 [Gordonia phage Cashline]|nr:hypothetical protein SEA_CASHLINE_66 [Gordonia phage Cashline]